MYFLVPYSLIDREDLTPTQKLIALYLARMADENGDGMPISASDIARKIKLSEDEVKLNLQVLTKYGIIEAEDSSEEALEKTVLSPPVFKELHGLSDEDFDEIERAFGFSINKNKAKLLYVKSGENLERLLKLIDEHKFGDDPVEEVFYALEIGEDVKKSALTEAVNRYKDAESGLLRLIEIEKRMKTGLDVANESVEVESDKFEEPRTEAVEGETSHKSEEEAVEEIVDYIGDVEKRIRERAAKLSLKLIERDSKDRLEKERSVAGERKEREERSEKSETDELLEFLSGEIKTEDRKEERPSRLSPRDRAFIRASAVYKSTKVNKSKIDETTSK